jgi:hypothetical protein
MVFTGRITTKKKCDAITFVLEAEFNDSKHNSPLRSCRSLDGKFTDTDVTECYKSKQSYISFRSKPDYNLYSQECYITSFFLYSLFKKTADKEKTILASS